MQLDDNIQVQFDEIAKIQAVIESLRPFSPDAEARVMQKLRLDWNYHSNAIEGNTLTYGETLTFLRYGLTAKGKPLKDHLDIKGHNQAIEWLMQFVRNKETLTETDIRNLHCMVLVEPYQSEAETHNGQKTLKTITIGEYKKQPNHVRTTTGEIHYYAAPDEVAPRMFSLISWYRAENEKQTLHPIVIAAKFHHEFTAIHPFDDGNGRMARLLMNLILMQHHYPPIVIKQDKASRNQYYFALSQADAGDLSPLIVLLKEQLIHSLQIYIKAAKGESIEEPDDFEKDVALFKKEMDGLESVKPTRTLAIQVMVYEKTLAPLVTACFEKLNQLSDTFVTTFHYAIDNDSIQNQAVTVNFYKPLKDGKWQFKDEKARILADGCQNWLQWKLVTNKDDEECLSFGVFYQGFNKKDYQPFNINAQFFVRLGAMQYDIYFGLSREIGSIQYGGLQPYFTRYYDQNISTEEISTFAQTIGKETLSFIKQQLKQIP
ncbi:MAG: Fic family protein [Sphingobacteriales bacterium]|nr:MAG: Fic family protein [Sphingobacteriales bacterium]